MNTLEGEEKYIVYSQKNTLTFQRGGGRILSVNNEFALPCYNPRSGTGSERPI